MGSRLADKIINKLKILKKSYMKDDKVGDKVKQPVF